VHSAVQATAANGCSPPARRPSRKLRSEREFARRRSARTLTGLPPPHSVPSSDPVSLRA
jgi:hypothetical protein